MFNKQMMSTAAVSRVCNLNDLVDKIRVNAAEQIKTENVL